MSKIFIVDDDNDLLLVTQSWLGQKNFDVTTFITADELMPNVIALQPDLILMDVFLGTTDGRQLCRSLKNDLPFSVKIILLSGDPMALLTYQDHYADGILNKPFEFEEIERKLMQHLSL